MSAILQEKRSGLHSFTENTEMQCIIIPGWKLSEKIDDWNKYFPKPVDSIQL